MCHTCQPMRRHGSAAMPSQYWTCGHSSRCVTESDTAHLNQGFRGACCFSALLSVHCVLSVSPLTLCCTLTQRLLNGDGLGIQCFAASSSAGIIAVAEKVRTCHPAWRHACIADMCSSCMQCDRFLACLCHPPQRSLHAAIMVWSTLPTPNMHAQGPSPKVWLYRLSDLKLLVSLPAKAELEYTALALSTDGELLAVCSGSPNASLSVWQWSKVREQQGWIAALAPHQHMTNELPRR